MSILLQKQTKFLAPIQRRKIIIRIWNKQRRLSEKAEFELDLKEGNSEAFSNKPH